MVWVCPPHTSMNLNASSPARAVIWVTRALAIVGSLYSSTNRMSLFSPLPRPRVPEPGRVPACLLRRLQTRRRVGAEDAGDDLGPLLDKLAGDGDPAGQQVADLFGRVDGVPRLFQLRPGVRPGPTAQCVTDQHTEDHSHHVPPVPDSLAIFVVQNASSSSS